MTTAVEGEKGTQSFWYKKMNKEVACQARPGNKALAKRKRVTLIVPGISRGYWRHMVVV